MLTLLLNRKNYFKSISSTDLPFQQNSNSICICTSLYPLCLYPLCLPSRSAAIKCTLLGRRSNKGLAISRLSMVISKSGNCTAKSWTTGTLMAMSPKAENRIMRSFFISARKAPDSVRDRCTSSSACKPSLPSRRFCSTPSVGQWRCKGRRFVPSRHPAWLGILPCVLR